MDKENLKYLVQQYLSGKANLQERNVISDLLKSDADGELFNEALVELIQAETKASPGNQDPWRKIAQDITRIDIAPPIVRKEKAALFRLYTAVAAAAVIFIMTGVYMYYFKEIGRSTQYGNKEIIQYKVISTRDGEQREIVLPDNSRVILNVSSSIKFPVSFSGGAREIELSGEAWFDVQHADKMPFTIQSGILTTTVLGTAFNIRAYKDQTNLSVSVERGKVQVHARNKLLKVLEKGRQLKVNGDSVVSILAIDTSSVAAWRKGDLYYKDEMVEDVIADLQRVFKEEISVSHNELMGEKITISFNRSIGIQNALEIICGVTGTSYVKRNEKYFID